MSQIKSANDSNHEREYAVLVPRVQTADGDALLLEVRSHKVKQPGEICFPGGKVEVGETTAEAATRETCEELGVSVDAIEVLSELEPLYMDDGRCVRPVLAMLVLSGHSATPHESSESEDSLGSHEPDAASDSRDPAELLESLELSTDEVAEVFLLPLVWLKEHMPRHFDLRTTPEDEVPEKLLEYLSHYGYFRDEGETDYLEYEGHGIWGLTARIIKKIMPLLLENQD